MTFKEAKEVFLNRGYVEVDGGTVCDMNKWRESCRVISEWLKQESCKDVVSSKEVKEILNTRGQKAIMTFDHFIKLLDYLPPVTPMHKWIAVSKGLPKEDGEYLCTIGLNGDGEYGYLQLCNYYTATHKFDIGEYDGPVIAWMPEPEPYKAEMESEEWQK